MANLPRVNNSAVAEEPIQTSFQLTDTRGRILYIIANRAVMMAKLTSWFVAWSTNAQPPNHELHQVPSAVSTALTTSDTSSRNPIDTTNPSECRRVRSKLFSPDPMAEAGARQIRSRL